MEARKGKEPLDFKTEAKAVADTLLEDIKKFEKKLHEAGREDVQLLREVKSVHEDLLACLQDKKLMELYERYRRIYTREGVDMPPEVAEANEKLGEAWGAALDAIEEIRFQKGVILGTAHHF